MNETENNKWNLHRWYAWKQQLNSKDSTTKIHLMDTPRSVMIVGSEYSGGRVDEHSVFKLTYPNKFTGRDAYKEVKAVQGSVADLRYSAKDARVMRSTKFFVDVIVFDLFKRERVMKKGVPQSYTRGPKEGEPMYEYKLVMNKKERKAILADIDNLVDSGEVLTFRKMFLNLGSGHFGNLEAATLGSRNMCECSGHLTAAEYVCGHCGEIVDTWEDSDLSAESFAELEIEDIRCEACGVVDRPMPLKECDSCEDPKPLGIGGVVVDLCISGKGKDSTISSKRITPIQEFLDHQGKHIVELDDQGEMIMDGDKPLFVEGLDVAAAAHWDFEGSITYPDHEISADLRLNKGDVGYTEKPEYDGGGYSSNRKPRRKFSL